MGRGLHEIETLALVAAVLSDSYSVYHTVHWKNVGSVQEFSNYGEVDGTCQLLLLQGAARITKRQ